MAKSKKIPKTRYPITLENWYAGKIRKMANSWNKVALWYLQHELKPLIKGGTVILDAAKDPSWFARVKSLVRLLGYSISNTQTDQQINVLCSQFVNAVNNFGFANTKQQTVVIGVNPIQSDKALDDYTKAKIAENAQLIKTMRQNYATKIQNDIYYSITKGTGANIGNIHDAIVKRHYQTNEHASMIARDQTGSIIGQTDAYRQQRAGAKSYIWRTMDDDRVRPAHAELEGKEFDYDDPNGGDDGQLPGEPINCRCFAQPVYDL